MRRLNQYVTRTVAAAILLVLIVILGLDLIAAVIDQMEDLRGNYTFTVALQYVLLSLPARVYPYLPFAALVGCLAGLGALAGSSELVAMRSAGVSVFRLSWFALKPALWLTLLGLLLAEFIAPKSQQIAESYRSMALQREASAVSEYGLWHREGNRFMHFNAVQPNGVLYGVTVYQFDEQRRLVRSLYADRASYQQDQWLLEDGRETRFDEQRALAEEFRSRSWQTELTPQLLNLLVLSAEDLPLSGLWRYAEYLRAQGINAGEYQLAFWNRLLQPLAIAGLVLLAISFVFGPLRQSTMGFRIFVGVLVGVVFRTSQDMLGPASLVYGFSPLLAALSPALLSAAVGLWLLRRTR